MGDGEILGELERSTREGVSHYWQTRLKQEQRQKNGGKADQGSRSAVTGGAQMDGFIELLCNVMLQAGISDASVFKKKDLQLPGFFRPTKEWDILAVQEDTLIAAIEVKSQVGPSFGNNFNNRTEEAMGSALDIWTAYREGKFDASPQPFLGYLFLLEDCGASQRPVRVKEPHFEVFPEFVDASYAKRYELFCRKLVLERQYTAAAFLTSQRESGLKGEHRIPAEDLSLKRFVKILGAHVAGVK